MAIVAMRHLRLIGLQSEREEMLRRLQHLGCLEITEPEPAADDPLLKSCVYRRQLSCKGYESSTRRQSRRCKH